MSTILSLYYYYIINFYKNIKIAKKYKIKMNSLNEING